MAALTFADLFDTVYGDDPVPFYSNPIRDTGLHLMSEVCSDDGWAVEPDAAQILTCRRCGALVPDSHTDVHLDWHRRIEPEEI